MRFFILFLMLFFISCSKKQEVPNTPLSKKEIVTKKDTSQTKPLEFELDYEANGKQVSKIFIYQTKVVPIDKESKHVYYRIDFHNKNQTIYSYKYVSKNVYEDQEWNVYDEMLQDSLTKKFDKRFISIGLGVPACGYSHKEFLFFVGKNTIQLVKEWYSEGDGPYSTGLEFYPNFVNGTLESFSANKIVVGGDESRPYNEDDEPLIVSFSDSSHFEMDNNRWIEKRITPKDKVFRKVATSFKKHLKDDTSEESEIEQE